jgi:hypothetical protein
MGLYNITLQDDAFYADVSEGSTVIIDKEQKTVRVEGFDQVFRYQHSEIEETLLEVGGILPLYNQFGRTVFRQMISTKDKQSKTGREAGTVIAPALHEGKKKQTKLDW